MKADATIDRQVEKFLKDAFIANQVRGQDGAGMFVIPHGTTPNPSFHKSRASGSSFLADSRGVTLLDEASRGWLSVGHVRAATHGEINTPNSHPFRIVRENGSCVIGVHNGTLRRWGNHADGKNHEVDSEWALAQIAKKGIEAFKLFDGAFAFIWWDSLTPDKVYIARNSERALHFLYSEDRKTIYGASEAGMLGWLAERNGVRTGDLKDANSGMFYFTPGKVYTFNQSDLSYTFSDFPKFDWNLLPYSAAPAYSTGHGMTHYSSRYTREQEQADYDVLWGKPNSKYMDQRQASVLEGIKQAIKKAKGVLTEESVIEGECEVVTDDDLQRFMDDTIAKATTQKLTGAMLLAHNEHFIMRPNDAGATRGEVKLARSRGVYGRVVMFKPEYYDKSTQSMLGEFYLQVEGIAVPEAGELRFDITESRARNLIDGDSILLASIVGVSHPNTPQQGYVVSRLSEDDRKTVNSTLRSLVN